MYGYGYRYNSGLVLGSGGGGSPFANTYSLGLDGVDDYLDLGATPLLNFRNPFTISFWAKWTTTGSFDVFMQVGRIIGSGTETSYVLLWKQSTGIGWSVSSSASVSINYNIALGLNDGAWHHIALTSDGTSGNGNIYVDGFLNTDTPTTTGATASTATHNNIGRGFQPTGRNVDTSMDEVSFFDLQKNASEIENIYNLGTPNDLSLLETPPTNWYRNGDNGSWKSPQWLIPNNENFAANKVSNYSFDFDGVDDEVNFGVITALQSTSNFSISCWVKTTDSLAQVMGFWNGQPHVIQVYILANNKLRFRVDGGYVNNTTAINNDTWFNLSFVYDGSLTGNVNRCKIYVNGVNETVNEAGTVPSVTAAGGLDFKVGTITNSTVYVDMKLDELSFFDYSLTQTEISTIYNGGEPTTISGAVAHYKMGEEATFSTNWTVPDAAGSNDGTSANMTIEDRVGEAPNSTNNALSFNMDEVDRVEDTPS